MTTEEQEVHRAACVYGELQDAESLGVLLTAVMDLPLSQWPDNACQITGGLKLGDAVQSVHSFLNRPIDAMAVSIAKQIEG